MEQVPIKSHVKRRHKDKHDETYTHKHIWMPAHGRLHICMFIYPNALSQTQSISCRYAWVYYINIVHKYREGTWVWFTLWWGIAIVKCFSCESRYVENFPGRLWEVGLKFPELQRIWLGYLNFQIRQCNVLQFGIDVLVRRHGVYKQ